MISRIREFVRCFRELYWEYSRKKRMLASCRERYPTCEFHENVVVREGCELAEHVVVWQDNYLSNCTVGRCTYFAPGSKISNCDIGAFCSVGPEVRIGLGLHPTRKYVSTYPGFYSTNPYSCKIRFREDPEVSESARIRIGNDVWIGARAMVLDGVEIGHGAIIGAGAVVTRNVEPYAVVGGVPARLIRKRFLDEEIEFLMRFRWWERDLKWLQKHAFLFSNSTAFWGEFSNCSCQFSSRTSPDECY